MIVVGTWWCEACARFKEANPGVPYVSVPEKVADWESLEGRAKKACGALRPRGYPVALSDDLSRVEGYPWGVAGHGEEKETKA